MSMGVICVQSSHFAPLFCSSDFLFGISYRLSTSQGDLKAPSPTQPNRAATMASSNMRPRNIDARAEESAFQSEIDQLKQWWSSPRWRYTKRPYTAEAIVSKRGQLRIEYPSNEQAKKLWGILEDRYKRKDASYTYGCLEPTALTQMAKYLDTVYVSGWQSSSTASSTDEPGPDLADYPYVRLCSLSHLCLTLTWTSRQPCLTK
jgi:isocitrate lyase